MMRKGIDVSGWNVVTDYAAAAADNVEFAILKIIRKDLEPDKLFETHWAGFTAAGTPIPGVYNYTYATHEQKYRSDARRVVEVLAGRKAKVWLDVEDATLRGLGVELINGIKAYAEVIQAAGLEFGVYTYVSFYNSYLKPYADMLPYSFWIARYPSSENMDNDIDPDLTKCPEIGKKVEGWQYSSKGQVQGINGCVDLNVWYEDEKKEGEEKPMVKPVDYKQNDSRWGGLSYAVDGEKSTIKSAGCGPTALADVLAAIVSPYIDPVTLAAWARYHNYKVKNSGTSYSFFEPCAAAYGVTVRRLNTSNVYKQLTPIHNYALDELKKGNWLIACMGKGDWTSSGHYVVAYGYEDGKVYINDPASTKANRACSTWENFKSQVKYYWTVEVPENIKKNGIVKDGDYRQQDFVREVQFCTGAKPDGKAGTETLSKTITVSVKKNSKHYVVIPLQKRFKKLGYYSGKIDKIAGKLFTAAVNGYQRFVLGYPTAKQDGEITAKARMWKSLLGMI